MTHVEDMGTEVNGKAMADIDSNRSVPRVRFGQIGPTC